MFGIGLPEMILILAIALIVIGPQKLPDLAKSLGRAMREFKKATSELKDSMHINELEEVKDSFDEMKADIKNGLDITKELNADMDTSPRSDTGGSDTPDTDDKVEALKQAYDEWKDTPADGDDAPDASDTAPAGDTDNQDLTDNHKRS